MESLLSRLFKKLRESTAPILWYPNQGRGFRLLQPSKPNALQRSRFSPPASAHLLLGWRTKRS
jgi:hypothetical protein